jgi:hypothetical protein
MLTIHTDSGTYSGWKELKIHVVGQGQSDEEKQGSQIRLRVLAADVYNVSAAEVYRNPQCSPITDYSLECPQERPVTNFNFSILSEPAGLVLDAYFALSILATQTPNQTEFLFTADWTQLCNEYALQDGEMFCIEAMVAGAFPLTNSSASGQINEICGGVNASCVSWAATDAQGQAIRVFFMNSSNVTKDDDLRYSSNILFCASDGQTMVRWDPTMTVNFDSQEHSQEHSGTDTVSAASHLPLCLGW